MSWLFFLSLYSRIRVSHNMKKVMKMCFYSALTGLPMYKQDLYSVSSSSSSSSLSFLLLSWYNYVRRDAKGSLVFCCCCCFYQLVTIRRHTHTVKITLTHIFTHIYGRHLSATSRHIYFVLLSSHTGDVAFKIKFTF